VAKPPSPLVGFNNNVKHLGRVFHVQTEDSGVNRPHVVTHLFADGGRIIRSTRTDYSEHLGRADMGVVVRRLMKEQHKAMFIALRDGQLDETIERICGPSEGASQSVRAPRKSRPAPTLPEIPLPPESSLRAPAIPVIQGPSGGTPIPRKPAPTLAELVLSDLEMARPRGVTEEAHPQGKPAPKGATPTLGTPAVSQRSAPGVRSPSGRYAAPRPAPIFSNPPGESSLFGGSSISEQSLDEVILSYLAEDLDGASEK